MVALGLILYCLDSLPRWWKIGIIKIRPCLISSAYMKGLIGTMLTQAPLDSLTHRDAL